MPRRLSGTMTQTARRLLDPSRAMAAELYLPRAGRKRRRVAWLRAGFSTAPGVDWLAAPDRGRRGLWAEDEQRVWGSGARPSASRTGHTRSGAYLIEIALARGRLDDAWTAAYRFGAGHAWEALVKASERGPAGGRGEALRAEDRGATALPGSPGSTSPAASMLASMKKLYASRRCSGRRLRRYSCRHTRAVRPTTIADGRDGQTRSVGLSGLGVRPGIRRSSGARWTRNTVVTPRPADCARVDKQTEFVLRAIEERDVRFVRMWFTDVLGFLKSVAVAPAELEGAFAEGHGLRRLGDRGLRPGLRVRHGRRIPTRPRSRCCPGATPARRRPGCSATSPCPTARPSYADPRYVLKRALKKAADLGFTFYTHPEVEFFLFKDPIVPGESPTPVDQLRLLRPHPAEPGQRLPAQGDHHAGADGHLGGVLPPRGRARASRRSTCATPTRCPPPTTS